jgi:hypothetical protein
VQGAVQDGGEEDEGEGGVEVDREEGDGGEDENDNEGERREETNEQKEDTNEVEEEGDEVEVGTLLQVPGLLIPFVRFYIQWNYFISCLPLRVPSLTPIPHPSLPSFPYLLS